MRGGWKTLAESVKQLDVKAAGRAVLRQAAEAVRNTTTRPLEKGDSISYPTNSRKRRGTVAPSAEQAFEDEIEHIAVQRFTDMLNDASTPCLLATAKTCKHVTFLHGGRPSLQLGYMLTAQKKKAPVTTPLGRALLWAMHGPPQDIIASGAKPTRGAIKYKRMVAMHSPNCRNRNKGCISHLMWGTDQQNNRDYHEHLSASKKAKVAHLNHDTTIALTPKPSLKTKPQVAATPNQPLQVQKTSSPPAAPRVNRRSRT
jgi:hypothetical protein